jgi:phage shock protein E
MFGNILKKLLGTPKHEQFQDFKNRGAIIIDVRSSGEFQGGHPKNAKNIPLDKIASQASAIKKMNKPVIVCCLSGGRSGQAASILKSAGVEVINAGPWQNVANLMAS